MNTRLAPLALVLLVTSSLACSSSSSSGDAAASGGSSATAGAGGSAAAGAGGSVASTGGSGGASAGGTSAGGSGTAGSGPAGGGGAGGGGVTMCPVGDPPGTLPKITGTFVQIDDKGTNGPPKMTGGDVTGTWVFDSLTQFLPAAGKGIVDPTMSSVTGTAWASFGADGSFKLSTDFDVSIVTTIVGTMMQHNVNQSVGTAMVSGSMIMPTATCTTSVSASGLEFTRTGGTGQLLIHTQSQIGQVDLLLGGTVK
jgi:hypothetical protein